MEFLVKNGATRIIQDLKDDIFKIRTLQDLTFHQDGLDKCRGIREKAKSLCDLISDPDRLDEEREFSKKNREKFRQFSSEESSKYDHGIGYTSPDKNDFIIGTRNLEKNKGDDKYYKKHKRSSEKKKNKKKKKYESGSDDQIESDSESSSDSDSERERRRRKKERK